MAASWAKLIPRHDEEQGDESANDASLLARSAGADVGIRMPFWKVWMVVGLQTVAFLLFAGALLQKVSAAEDQAVADLQQQRSSLEAEVRNLHQEKGQASKDWSARHPYQAVAHVEGHKLPEMYGRVKEKTIWAYWYHAESCPSAANCTLPAHIKLCAETVGHNRGGFDFRLLRKDEVFRYVSGTELPVRWHDLLPAQQKDSLMNALLARYGGVAWDISMILLRPLDDYWDEMVEQDATFRGYMYRINGRPWRHEEAMAVWFLMSRREGVFAAAVRSQVIGMGDRADTGAYLDWYRALGDHTLTAILSMYNYSLPKCFDDPTVPKQWACPEHEQPPWYKGLTGIERTDTRLILGDPRDGPQLPMAWIGMEMFNVLDDTDRSSEQKWADNGLGAPMHDTSCSSMKQCWEDEFMPRFQAGNLKFVKFFNHGATLDQKSREELLADADTYFYSWIRLSGLPV